MQSFKTPFSDFTLKFSSPHFPSVTEFPENISVRTEIPSLQRMSRKNKKPGSAAQIDETFPFSVLHNGIRTVPLPDHSSDPAISRKALTAETAYFGDLFLKRKFTDRLLPSVSSFKREEKAEIALSIFPLLGTTSFT